jgi:hypothetical protein
MLKALILLVKNENGDEEIKINLIQYATYFVEHWKKKKMRIGPNGSYDYELNDVVLLNTTINNILSFYSNIKGCNLKSVDIDNKYSVIECFIKLIEWLIEKFHDENICFEREKIILNDIKNTPQCVETQLSNAYDLMVKIIDFINTKCIQIDENYTNFEKKIVNSYKNTPFDIRSINDFEIANRTIENFCDLSINFIRLKYGLKIEKMHFEELLYKT